MVLVFIAILWGLIYFCQYYYYYKKTGGNIEALPGAILTGFGALIIAAPFFGSSPDSQKPERIMAAIILGSLALIAGNFRLRGAAKIATSRAGEEAQPTIRRQEKMVTNGLSQKDQPICFNCLTEINGKPKITFLGFRKFYCSKCGQSSVYPMTTSRGITNRFNVIRCG